MTDARITFEGGEIVTPRNLVGDARAILEAGEYDIDGMGFATPPRVLDIGANVGAFAIWAALRWPGCQVDCYEPSPVALGYLERNRQPHMTIHPVAVVGPARGETVTMRHGAQFLSCTGIDPIPEEPDNLGADAFVATTLRARDLPKAEMVKIDGEGIEVEVLRDYDLSGTHVVMLEFHRREDRRLVEDMLTAHGFTLFSSFQRRPYLGTLRFVRE